jgi:hypothetical protein
MAFLVSKLLFGKLFTICNINETCFPKSVNVKFDNDVLYIKNMFEHINIFVSFENVKSVNKYKLYTCYQTLSNHVNKEPTQKTKICKSSSHTVVNYINIKCANFTYKNLFF